MLILISFKNLYMKLIKLDAIDSTNDFLKGLSQRENLENYTAVTAKTQTKGRGQRGAIWNSESGKNLIASILINNSIQKNTLIFDLNVIVTISVIEALKSFKISNLKIKWPNDIMAENKKVAGILIENTIKEQGIINSVIGIGLNVNQIDFQNLPKASSLKNIMGKDFDIDEILIEIISKLKINFDFFENDLTGILWDKYHKYLFKKGIPTLFEDYFQNKFMGIIQKVNSNGELLILLEDDSLKTFEIKEITMLY